MKIKITMKDPDTLHDCIREAAVSDVQKLNLPQDESEALISLRIEKALVVAQTWFENDEYLTVEIDTESRTCTVVSR